MSYPFTDIPPKIYPNTFLKDVSLAIQFPGASHVKQTEDSEEFFFNRFSLRNLKKNSEGKIPVRSEDGIIRFLFGASSAEVKIKYPGYRSFEQILDWVDTMTQYLSIQDCYGKPSVTISKFNELRYELNRGSNAGMHQIMLQVFSMDLMTYQEDANMKDSGNLEGLSRWERRVVLPDEETHSKISLDFGFYKDEKLPEGSDKKGKLTLKSDINFETEDIYTPEFKTVVLKKYNKILDNAFHWCMTPSVIKAMG